MSDFSNAEPTVRQCAWKTLRRLCRAHSQLKGPEPVVAQHLDS
jgi:hypothetical protein